MRWADQRQFSIRMQTCLWEPVCKQICYRPKRIIPHSSCYSRHNRSKWCSCKKKKRSLHRSLKDKCIPSVYSSEVCSLKATQQIMICVKMLLGAMFFRFSRHRSGIAFSENRRDYCQICEVCWMLRILSEVEAQPGLPGPSEREQNIWSTHKICIAPCFLHSFQFLIFFFFFFFFFVMHHLKMSSLETRLCACPALSIRQIRTV